MLKKKADVFNVFKQFKTMVEKKTGKSIKGLRTDNGGEFTSLEFKIFVRMKGLLDIKLLFILLIKMEFLNI